MQNVPGRNSSSGRKAAYTNTSMPNTHGTECTGTQPTPTSLGQKTGENADFSSAVVDPTAAFQFSDPFNQILFGYPTAADPLHVINEYNPSQPAHPGLHEYQPGGEILEQLFLSRPPMVPLPEAAAVPPALTYGIRGGRGQEPMIPQLATLRCKWEGCTYSRSFNRREELLRHVRNLHVSPRSYPCETCGRRFNQSYNRAVHMRVHQMGGVSRG
ncbi:hypothetical protein M747DRAFT_373462 [Aspergillus niger ATCC 13496]|uniref:Contig An12c0090, genomic contig n=3 Tax=Aspergillus niger TaxID=5061 RepID=A2QZ28_ASPNC|nr:uncharacterized protein An12g03400 [Aspergillus niger]RDH16496.1 hypothetical protein M747DRAFT_373462 [Aspergillus niger ATCC 13496]CAK46113.1 unnamed protein product [Aspergillus niger]